jgi:hypothetical protein
LGGARLKFSVLALSAALLTTPFFAQTPAPNVQPLTTSPSEQPYSFVDYVAGENEDQALARARSEGMKSLFYSYSLLGRQAKGKKNQPPEVPELPCSIPAQGLKDCVGYNGARFCSMTDLQFVDGKLAYMFCQLGHFRYSDIVEAITAKYGKPSVVSSHEVKTRMGATFTSADFAWSNGMSSIKTNEYYDDLDTSMIVLESPRLHKEYQEREPKKSLPAI